MHASGNIDPRVHTDNEIKWKMKHAWDFGLSMFSSTDVNTAWQRIYRTNNAQVPDMHTGVEPSLWSNELLA